MVSMSDGKLEVIGLRSVFHLGQIGAGLTEGGIRIAQGSSITLTFKANSPPMPGKVCVIENHSDSIQFVTYMYG